MDSTGVGTSIMAQVLFFSPVFICSYTGRTRANCGADIVESSCSPFWTRPCNRSGHSGITHNFEQKWNHTNVAGWPSFLLSNPVYPSQSDRWQNNSIQYFTLHRVIDYWKCILLIDPQLNQLIQVLRTGSEKKLITGWLPLVLDLSGRTMLVAGTTWNRCWLLCFNAHSLQVLHIMGRLQLF